MYFVLFLVVLMGMGVIFYVDRLYGVVCMLSSWML